MTDSFMTIETIRKGFYATIECAKCGTTNHWHEWIDDGQSCDLVNHRCNECGGEMDEETLWVSPSQTWYACRYSAPGYLDCTDWSYGRNRRELEREVRDMYEGY